MRIKLASKKRERNLLTRRERLIELQQVFPGEFNIQSGTVFPNVRDVAGLRDDYYAVLSKQPRECYLCRSCADSRGDPFEPDIVQHVALLDWRVSHHSQAVL